MQEIADWLKTLGMSEYAARFAENRIDFSVLRNLTDQHLKDLGVVLGDRLKLLRAIAERATVTALRSARAPWTPKSLRLPHRVGRARRCSQRHGHRRRW